MSAPLGRAAPNAVAFVLAHLLPAAASPLNLGSKRWKAGGPLPYWMVTRIAGPADFVSDFPVVRLYAFAGTDTDCQHSMDLANKRMQLLIDDSLTQVVMADASSITCQWCERQDGPRDDPPPYSSVLATDPASAAVSRLVTEYRLGLKLL